MVMLATPSTPASNRTGVDIRTLEGTHAFDLKIDGVRALLAFDGRTATLTNRNKVDVSGRYPDIIAAVERTFTLPMTLDGEVVAQDGTFYSTAIRDKNERPTPALIARIPVRFMVFDVLSVDGHSVTDQPWTERRHLLDVGKDAWPDLLVATPFDVSADFLTVVREQGLEGVIAKRLDSPYRMNARSRDWIKFKCLHSVSCLVTGYTAGTGSRAHFGAMHLALIGDGELVHVGRVGTGFSAAQTHSLKAALDAGEVLVVEVECLNITNTKQLRFPVFKGVRTDVQPGDCTVAQLSTIPTC